MNISRDRQPSDLDIPNSSSAVVITAEPDIPLVAIGMNEKALSAGSQETSLLGNTTHDEITDRKTRIAGNILARDKSQTNQMLQTNALVFAISTTLNLTTWPVR